MPESTRRVHSEIEILPVRGVWPNEPEVRTVTFEVSSTESEARTITVPVTSDEHEPVRAAVEVTSLEAKPETTTATEPAVSSPWMTATAAAKYAGVGRRLIYREVRAGRLRAAVLGDRRDLRIHRAWIDAWLTASAKR